MRWSLRGPAWRGWWKGDWGGVGHRILGSDTVRRGWGRRLSAGRRGFWSRGSCSTILSVW